MNLNGLIIEAQRLAGRVDTQWNDRTTRWINEAQEVWCSAIPWPTLAQVEDHVCDGTSKLFLPQHVYTINAISDFTNKRFLKPWTAMDRDFPENHLAPASGAPQLWRELGLSPIIRHITTPTPLVVQAAESLVATVYIAGDVLSTAASGTAEGLIVVDEAINIINNSGVTSVRTYSGVHVISKDVVTPTDITVWDTSSNVMARIPADDFRSVYRVVEFLPTPPAGTVIRINYQHKFNKLSQLYQTAQPGVDTEFLIWYAASLIHTAQGEEDKAAAKMARAQETLQRHIYQERMHGDKDLSAAPEPNYWNFEDQFEFPGNS